jgi:serine protease AprX
MTIGVPGNVPYVITVGAMSDNFTPSAEGDDYLASFSSAGPTYEGFVKPEIVAPGGHMLGAMHKKSSIAVAHPEFHRNGKWFEMSGTSQAAAIVSGAVALLLQNDPGLSPDDVKCRLMASAKPAVDASGNLAYSVFQQGAGTVDVGAAITNSNSHCANQGLDIANDLNGSEHYAGPANQDVDGNFYIMDCTNGNCATAIAGNGYHWDGSYSGSNGFTWDASSNGFTWDAISNGFTWDASRDGFTWDASSDGFTWDSGSTAPMSVNVWVAQE